MVPMINLSRGHNVLDNALAILILGVYVFGSAVLLVKALLSRRKSLQSAFSSGELALLPEGWRRWLLDERKPSSRP